MSVTVDNDEASCKYICKVKHCLIVVRFSIRILGKKEYTLNLETVEAHGHTEHSKNVHTNKAKVGI